MNHDEDLFNVLCPRCKGYLDLNKDTECYQHTWQYFGYSMTLLFVSVWPIQFDNCKYALEPDNTQTGILNSYNIEEPEVKVLNHWQESDGEVL